MSLLSPWSLLGLLLVVPLVLLYVLKRKREDRIVGSTLLWEAALRDLRADRPWQRLIPNLALLLQLLAILFGIFALARPTTITERTEGDVFALVIDTSASMNAIDADGTRLERARQAAASLLESATGDAEAMVIAAGLEPNVITGLTKDRGAVEAAIERVESNGNTANVGAAIRLASDRLRGRSRARIVVFTDAANDERVDLSGLDVPVDVRQVGESADNAGIVALDIRGRGQDDRADIFVRVAHYGSDPLPVFVNAETVDGQVVATRRVDLPKEGVESVVMSAALPPNEDGEAPIVRVSLSGASGVPHSDALPLDDEAFAPAPGARKLRVFLVGAVPAMVERVLLADREVELFRTSLAKLESRPADAPPLSGLWIFSSQLPSEAPEGDSWVIAPRSTQVFEATIGEVIPAARVVRWEEADPRLRFVSLNDVTLGDVRPVAAPARPLVVSDGGAAIAAIERRPGETIVLSFDPDVGRFASTPPFVILFRNLLERARARRSIGQQQVARLGVPIRVRSAGEGEVEVTLPSGETASATARDGFAVINLAPLPGVYRVKSGARRFSALRAMLLRGETDLRARQRFGEGTQEVESTPVDTTREREWWPYLALLLLLFVLLDIGWATRRAAA